MSAQPEETVIDDPQAVVEPETPVEDVQDTQPLDVEQLQRELDHERTLRTTAEQKAEFWYDQRVKPVIAQPEPVKGEPEPEFDYLTAVSEKQFGRVDEHINKVVEKRAKEIAAQMIGNKVEEMGTLNRYQRDFPELADEQSPMFQAVKSTVAEMKQNPRYQSLDDVVIAELAINTVALKQAKTAPVVNTPKVEDKTVTTEANRRAMITAQGGAPGRRVGAKEQTAYQVTPEITKICLGFGMVDAQGQPDYEKYFSMKPTKFR